MVVRLDDDRRRALLATRQLATSGERVGRTPLVVADDLGPLHSTDPATAHLQVHARADVAVEDVDRALYDDRELLRHTTLRATVHLLPPGLVAPAHRAYNHRLLRTSRRRIVRLVESSRDVPAGTDATAWLEALEDEVAAAVAAMDRPSGGELADAVPGLRVTYESAPGKSYSRPSRLTSPVIQLVIADGRIVRDRPHVGDLTSSAYTYAPIERWFPDGIPPMAPADALAALVQHHLRPFAGSSVVDLTWWTGLPKGQVERALATVGAVAVARDDGEVGFVLPDDDLEVADLDGDPRVALLPGLDATPMGVKQRDWFLGAHEDELFDRTGNIGPTVWCRGRVVGSWTQRGDGEVVWALLTDVGADAEAAVEAEAARTQAWLGDVRVNWRFPTPLQQRLETA